MSERVATNTILYAIPRLARDVVARPAVLSLLEKANDTRLLAFVAPSGFGKTTFLTQHARGLRTPVLWLELQESTDANGLSDGLLEAFRLAFTQLKLETKLEVGSEKSAGQIASLLSETAEQLTIVLDQADHLNLEASRWLEGFTSELPEGTRLLVAGRELEHLRLPSLIAEGQALVIGPNELAFTPEETGTYLKARGFRQDMLEVQRSFEGWPAGIALVAAGAALNLSPTDLVRDVLQRLPDEIRELLPEASVLEVWNEDAALELGCRLPEGWLRATLRAGLPLIPLGGQTYRPLQALRDVLEIALRRKALRHATLHLAAGGRDERHNQYQQAIAHYLLAHREDLVLQLLQRLAPEMYKRTEFVPLIGLLESLPTTMLPKDLLEMLGGALVETGQHARGEVILRPLRAKKQLSLDGLWMLGKLALREGNFERVLEIANEGLGKVARDQIEAARFLYLQGFAFFNFNKFEQSLQCGLEIFDLAQKHDDMHQAGEGMVLIQNGYFHLNNLEAGEHWSKQAIENGFALGNQDLVLNASNTLAYIRMFHDRIPETKAILEPLVNNPNYLNSETYSTALETLADASLWDGEYAAAAERYHASVVSSEQLRQFTGWRTRLKYAEALWRNGQHHQAQVELSTVIIGLQRQPQLVIVLQERLFFIEGLIAFEQNQLHIAKQKLQLVAGNTDDSTQPPRALAFLAEIARREQQLEYKHLERLVGALDRLPSDAVLKTDQHHLQDLWRETQAKGWFTARLAKFMPVQQAQVSRFKLEIGTFGKLQVRVAGQTIKLPFAKAGELLVWLALHGASNHERVINALWDGSNEDKHHEYFRVAVRRLRAALAGSLPEEASSFNPLLFERGSYALSDRFEVVIDTHQAKLALENNLLENNLLEEAALVLEAYRGEFLPGVDTQWVTEIRTQCLESTLTLALTLGGQLEGSNLQEALKAYRRAIELEPLNELGHLGLIRTHLALGGLPAANQAYTNYARMLNEEFGLEPSPNLRQNLNELGLRV